MLGNGETEDTDDNGKNKNDSEDEETEEIEKSDDDCDQESNSGSDEHVFDEQKARRAVAKFFCSEAFPPRMVNDVFFRRILNVANPQFHIGIDTVERDCLEIYEEERAKIKQILRNLDGRISLSVDILRHERRCGYDYHYLCVKAHFIDDTWKLKNWILNYFRIWYPNEMATDEAIQKSLSDWGIESKISTITMGNDDLHDDITEIVKDHIHGKNELQLNACLFRVYCCADILSQMVKDAYEEIDDAIFKIRQIVYWGKSLPLWVITLEMLQEALTLESKGEFYSSDEYEDYDIPSPDEWNRVRGVCKLVESIYNVAHMLFDMKHSTAPMYLHNLGELQASLTRESVSCDSFVSTLAQKMLEKLDKYWKDMFLVLSIATVMDPRCKMKFIEFSLSRCEGSDHDSEVTIVLEAIRRLYNDYVTPISEREYCVSDASSSDSDEEGHQDSEDVTIKWLQEYDQFIQSNHKPPKSELDLYLEEDVFPWSQDFNALSWWRVNSHKYPHLSKMARDFLAIPISLATSFEAYYTTQRQAEERVISLGRDITNALMCTQSWFRRH
uniref:Putative zinc finger BED domain-containing protein RICESLEEPER 2-like n=1 Tax=Davidia involucrata TaxID=16924 RepID=A0A5B7BMW0_DAVIN